MLCVKREILIDSPVIAYDLGGVQPYIEHEKLNLDKLLVERLMLENARLEALAQEELDKFNQLASDKLEQLKRVEEEAAELAQQESDKLAQIELDRLERVRVDEEAAAELAQQELDKLDDIKGTKLFSMIGAALGETSDIVDGDDATQADLAEEQQPPEETDGPTEEETDGPTEEETDGPPEEETDGPPEEETDGPPEETEQPVEEKKQFDLFEMIDNIDVTDVSECLVTGECLVADDQTCPAVGSQLLGLLDDLADNQNDSQPDENWVEDHVDLNDAFISTDFGLFGTPHRIQVAHLEPKPHYTGGFNVQQRYLHLYPGYKNPFPVYSISRRPPPPPPPPHPRRRRPPPPPPRRKSVVGKSWPRNKSNIRLKTVNKGVENIPIVKIAADVSKFGLV